jgi:proteasome lid subunit RPN8/RPN11/tetratricopeptide (TPR) repeat protein
MRKVVVTAKAFVSFVKFSAQFASFKGMRANWVESMGFLFCKQHMDKYIVADAVGMTSGNSVYVEMSGQQIAQVERLETERPGLFLGGWIHTHPGLGLFFSDTDIQNEMFYQQRNEDGLGIVFDLSLISPVFIGFKVFRLHGPNAHTYYEVTDYELSGFTEDLLRDAFDTLGIDHKITHQLAMHLGFGSSDFVEVEEKVEIPDTNDPAGTGKEFLAKGLQSVASGKTGRAMQEFKVAEQLCAKGGVYEGQVSALLQLAEIYALRQDPTKAIEQASKVKKIALVPNSPKWFGLANLLMGKIRLNFDKEEEAAVKDLQAAANMLEGAKEYALAAEAAELGAGLQFKRFKRAEAKALYEKSLSLLDKILATSAGKTSPLLQARRKAVTRKIASIQEKGAHPGIQKI